MRHVASERFTLIRALKNSAETKPFASLFFHIGMSVTNYLCVVMLLYIADFLNSITLLNTTFDTRGILVGITEIWKEG